MNWDSSEINSLTDMRLKRINTQIKWISNVQEDPEKNKRLAAQECVVCFYTTQICGNAIMRYDCQKCGITDTWPNTCTPKLCKACSAELKACRSCGADLNLVERA